jgi:hypothetical protein
MANGTVVASVAGSALTLAIKTLAGADPSASDPVTFIFRNSTAALGNYVVVQMTSAGNPGSQVTIPSGATLGHVSNRNQQIILYIVNFGGTPLLAVGTPLFDLSVRTRACAALTSGSTSASTLYCGGGTGAIPYYPLARCVSNQATAGTWAANPTQIDLAPFTLPSNYCKLSLIGNVNIPNGGFSVIPYDTVVSDNDGIRVGSSIQPNVPGTYQCVCNGYCIGSVVQVDVGVTRNGFFQARVISGASGEGAAALTATVSFNGTSDVLAGLVAPIVNNPGIPTSQATGLDGSLNNLSLIRVGP